MKVAFGLMGVNWYPFSFARGQPAPDDVTRKVFDWARSAGFDGVEMEDCWVDFYEYPDQQVLAFRSMLDALGMPVPCFKVRHKSLCDPEVGEENKQKLTRSLEIASLLGARIVSVSLAKSPDAYGVPEGDLIGRTCPPGSSQDASDQDFERTVEALSSIGAHAKGLGVSVAIEVHQFSVADTSESTLKLLDAVGLDNIRVNPDLGNMVWAYEEPAESWDQGLMALAPWTIWWHCKNMHRVHVPELHRAFFVPSSLAEGEIDYRYAIAIMRQAGYEGHLLIEGVHNHDMLSLSKKSLEYVRSVLSHLA